MNRFQRWLNIDYQTARRGTIDGVRALVALKTDYEELMGQEICVNCNFQSKYRVFINQIKMKYPMAKEDKKPNFVVKRMFQGIQLRHGSTVTLPANPSDEIAVQFAAEHPHGAELFDQIPKDLKKRIDAYFEEKEKQEAAEAEAKAKAEAKAAEEAKKAAKAAAKAEAEAAKKAEAEAKAKAEAQAKIEAEKAAAAEAKKTAAANADTDAGTGDPGDVDAVIPIDIETASHAELRALAKLRNIKGYHKMTTAKLRAALQEEE